MHRKKILPLLLLAALLCGCSSSADADETSDSAQTSESTAEPSHQTTQPAAEETEPTVDQGPVTYVNGTRIEDTFRVNDTVYISAQEFCLALDGTAQEDGTCSFAHNGASYSFSPDNSHMMRNETAVILLSPVLHDQGKAYLPMEDMCQIANLSVYWDTEFDGVYCTAAAWFTGIPAGYDVPVLMYHAVSNETWGISELFVKPESMEEQLQYLTENGYDTIFFEDLCHIEDYDKPVILTFDDGYEDNYTELLPLLQKYNAKATVFVVTDFVGDDHYMNADQILEMADSGLVSIQSHTVSHPNLDELSLEDQQRELAESKLRITRLSRREPYVLAYPTGKYNGDTLSIIGNYYSFGIKMTGNLYSTQDNPFEVNRYYISRNTTLQSFQAMLE